MKAADAYADLRDFGKPVMTTEDASLRLRCSLSATSRMLGRLQASGLVHRLRPGLWSLRADLDPLALPEYLTAPYPAYVSCHSALYYHGLISQIPQVIFVASLGRTRRIATSIADYSVHRLAPEFFGGYETSAEHGVKMATAEKALLDVLYLSAAKSRLFARLPEVELPRTFRVRECRRWLAVIPADYRRRMVATRLDAILRAQDATAHQ